MLGKCSQREPYPYFHDFCWDRVVHMCVLAHWGKNNQAGCCYSQVAHLFLEKGSVNRLEVTKRLTDQWAPRIFLPLSPECRSHKHDLPHAAFTWVLGIEHGSPCLHGTSFTGWVISMSSMMTISIFQNEFWIHLKKKKIMNVLSNTSEVFHVSW